MSYYVKFNKKSKIYINNLQLTVIINIGGHNMKKKNIAIGVGVAAATAAAGYAAYKNKDKIKAKIDDVKCKKAKKKTIK